ncbi:glycosyltransferase [Dongia sp.]|uniref:glycosyltransferase n=1 Tax=Dongia sp. TaxID=1977262 RepID=UPI0035B11909
MRSRKLSRPANEAGTETLPSRIEDPAFAPRLAIVIPVYKHSVLMTEAVESALAQQAGFDMAIIIVDDGCPFPETEIIGTTYATAHDNVFYVRKPNGGLSSARNYGVDLAFELFPELEAIYFLDADNRITPPAMQDVFDFLQSRPEIAWVYPNIDKFGIGWNGSYQAPYSRLLHLTFDNICEAGSMVSRRVFDAGIRFDETMKAGFEDWEFWLQCISHGFQGANYPFFGFDYRQRAESMLRDSHRTKAAIMSYIREKHKKLFQPDTLMRWEHEESPRFAAIATGTYAVSLFTDPTAAHAKIDLETYIDRYWAALAEPDAHGIPPFMLWIAPAHLEAMRKIGVLHNVLWHAERLAEKHHLVAIRLEHDPGRIELRQIEAGSPDYMAKKPLAWMCSVDIFKACVDDISEEWIGSIRGRRPSPDTVELVVRGPFKAFDLDRTVLSATNGLLSTLGVFRDSAYRRVTNARWTWRGGYFPAIKTHYRLLREALGASPILSRIAAKAQAPRIGFLLPIASFGGVEKVAYAMARELTRLGYETHLYVLGKSACELVFEPGDFASINFLMDDYPLWGGAHQFAGHDLMMAQDEGARVERLMGLLAGLDVVVNCQVAPVNAILGELRRRGVKILDHVHVLDRTRSGRAAGHPYIALAYEHIYDLILTCSEQMVDWFHGMGVPSAKLMHIRNAPSFELRDAEVRTILRQRQRRGVPDRLKALFLGRLDSQKGIERLYAAARLIKRRSLPIDIRLIGSEVLNEQGQSSWTERFGGLGIGLEPAIYSTKGLTDAFAEADVLLLTSRWEGAPLTILEAQRVGCVPVVTAVGAVGELVEHDVDGLLIQAEDDNAVAQELVTALERLLGEPHLLNRLSTKAADAMAARTWAENLSPLIDRLEAWFPFRSEEIELRRTVTSSPGR